MSKASTKSFGSTSRALGKRFFSNDYHESRREN